MAHSPNDTDTALIQAINALADSLKNQRSPHIALPSDDRAQAFVFDPGILAELRAISHVPAPPFDLLVGIERTKNTLLENSRRFAEGNSANNALLWGARGMGKSTLIRSLHNKIISEFGVNAPALVEIHREDHRRPAFASQCAQRIRQAVCALL